jgi:hypothetical protein
VRSVFASGDLDASALGALFFLEFGGSEEVVLGLLYDIKFGYFVLGFSLV